MGGERARRLAVLVVALAVAVSSYWWMPAMMRRMRFFDVRRIEVTGATYRTPADIVAALQLPDTPSVFDELGDLEERLRRLRGIARAEVDRRLPGTLLVRIREVEPVALAQSRAGLVAVDDAGQPLPYDLTTAPVDVPVVGRAEPRLTQALAAIRTASGGLYASASAAWLRGREVVLDVGEGLIRLDTPVADSVLEAIGAVRRDLAQHQASWTEIDARFGAWIVVRQ